MAQHIEIMKWRISTCMLLILLLATAAQAQLPRQGISEGSPQSSSATTNSSVEVVDLTKRFLKFYDTAVAEKADPERRWQLWKQLYGFAAVPPIPESDKMARGLLDHAWPDYPKYLDRIRQGASILRPSPGSILESVVKLLGLQEPVKVKLIVFVGGLENNAFAYTDHGVPAVAIPVESKDEELQLKMTHEFTHAVHAKLAASPGDTAKVAGVARLVLMEGLAMRVTEKLMPGLTDDAYTSAHSSEWLIQARGRQTAILKGIQQHLDENSSDAFTRFTFGTGTTGLGREAYYAGWVVVGELEKQGMSLADIARVPPSSSTALVSKVIDSLTRTDNLKHSNRGISPKDDLSQAITE